MRFNGSFKLWYFGIIFYIIIVYWCIFIKYYKKGFGIGGENRIDFRRIFSREW